MCAGVLTIVSACLPADKGTKVEIRNFLGEKIVRVVSMLPGVTCERSAAVLLSAVSAS